MLRTSRRFMVKQNEYLVILPFIYLTMASSCILNLSKSTGFTGSNIPFFLSAILTGTRSGRIRVI